MHETHFPDSTVIHSAAYDEETDELTIRLRTGRTYIYREVPEWVYDELHAAESAGRYYNLRIRDAYPYSEIVPLRRSPMLPPRFAITPPSPRPLDPSRGSRARRPHARRARRS
jgi:KTSC domain